MIYRALKTSTHELCHVLYLTHCHFYECLMNGSNLLSEADLKPFTLCPICLRKLLSYISNPCHTRHYLSQNLSHLRTLENDNFTRELAQLESIVVSLSQSDENKAEFISIEMMHTFDTEEDRVDSS